MHRVAKHEPNGVIRGFVEKRLISRIPGEFGARHSQPRLLEPDPHHFVRASTQAAVHAQSSPAAVICSAHLQGHTAAKGKAHETNVVSIGMAGEPRNARIPAVKICQDYPNILDTTLECGLEENGITEGHIPRLSGIHGTAVQVSSVRKDGAITLPMV